MSERVLPGFRTRVLSGAAAGALALGALAVSDLLALTVALAVAVGVRLSVLPAVWSAFARPTFPLAHYLRFWWIPLLYLGALAHAGLYTRRAPAWEEVRRCAGGATVSAVLIFAALSIAKLGDDISRPVVVLAWATLLVFLPASRLLTKQVLLRLGPWRRRVLLVGHGEQAEHLQRALARDRTLGYTVIDVIADSTQAPMRAAAIDARDVIVAAPHLDRAEFLGLVEHLRQIAENVIIAPDLSEVPVLGIEVLGLFEDRTILLRVPNNLLRPWNLALKRGTDLLLGGLVALIALPVMLIAAVAVKSTSRGPVFHVEPRVGRKGRLFDCVKLRTMYLDADRRLTEYLAAHPDASGEWERFRKLRSFDPRVTPAGRWLRRYGVDEVPQVLNVLRGDMSLVGPRPYLPREMPLVEGTAMLDLRPGMTGLWQVSGKNTLDFPQRGKLDRWYVSNWSVWLDLIILVKTVPMVLRGEGSGGPAHQ